MKKIYLGEKLININKKVTSNKIKHVLIQNELKPEQEEMNKSQTFDSSLFIGQSYFFNDGWQKVTTFTKDDHQWWMILQKHS